MRLDLLDVLFRPFATRDFLLRRLFCFLSHAKLLVWSSGLLPHIKCVASYVVLRTEPRPRSRSASSPSIFPGGSPFPPRRSSGEYPPRKSFADFLAARRRALEALADLLRRCHRAFAASLVCML